MLSKAGFEKLAEISRIGGVQFLQIGRFSLFQQNRREKNRFSWVQFFLAAQKTHASK
jgi:hypothetical protein